MVSAATLGNEGGEHRVLDRIQSPEDLRRLTSADLVLLTQELREFLIGSVAKTGGHLGPNLGVVELTIALHRVFESPSDTIVWDTGHQSYVHKLLTGRKDFAGLRKDGGVSGYPSRSESPHDVVENSHASTALSWADGIALQKFRSGDTSATVAVIGDGALTGGMAWEALNNIACGPDMPLVIVVNDNGRSYAPTVGGLAQHLDGLRTSSKYEETLARGKSALMAMGPLGEKAYDALHGLKAGLKDVLTPQAMFSDLDIKYMGPVDGHDLVGLELALQHAKSFGGPVLVHVITEKGRGYVPAEEDLADRFHAVGQIHPETGLPVAPARFGWTKVFAEQIVDLALHDQRIVGVTAAMMAPVGLQPLADTFPSRVVDVGIAEQHAFTLAAGMAFEGAHPVVCVYATFMNRAFDQLLMDVALHRAPVTVVLDRAGLTGDDGASHNGMWDLSLAAMVPGLRVFAPRDAATLRRGIAEAVAWDRGPTLVRYPKGEPPEGLAPLRTVNGIDVLYSSHGEAGDGTSLADTTEQGIPVTAGATERETPGAGGAPSPASPWAHPASPEARPASPGSQSASPSVLLVAVGSTVPAALEAAEQLQSEGVAVTVADPGWVLPVSPALVQMATRFDAVVSIEDGVEVGGVGSEIAREVGRAGGPPVEIVGIPREFLRHAPRACLVAETGLDSRGIAKAARRAVARLSRLSQPSGT